MIIHTRGDETPGTVHKFKYDKARDGLAFGLVAKDVGFIVELVGEEIDRLLLALHEGGFEGLSPTDKTVARHGPHGGGAG